MIKKLSDLFSTLRTNKKDLPDRQPSDRSVIAGTYSDLLVNINSYAARSIGKVRTTNEDSLFSLTFTTAGNDISHAIGLFIIADGMGGHHHGEIASWLSVNTVAHYLLEMLLPHLLSTSILPPSEISLHELVQTAFKNAQDGVTQTAAGSGTTLTMALIIDQQLTIAHIGDSRCYIKTPTQLFTQLTHDHSLVNRLIEIGQITPTEAASHPQKNVLYKAIGQKGSVEPDLMTISLDHGTELLLCSDGLWGQLTNQKLNDTLEKNVSLQDAAESLVNSANKTGGPDNISVILVKVT